MRRFLALLSLAAFPALGAVPTVTVTGHVLAPNGASYGATGSITCTIQPVSGSATDAATGKSERVGVAPYSLILAADGTVTGALVPNDLISPSGTVYFCQISLNTTPRRQWSETWDLSGNRETVDIGAISRPLVAPVPPVGLPGPPKSFLASNGVGGAEAVPGTSWDSSQVSIRALNGARNAASFATGGNGTSGSPWTGWTAALATGGEVVFQRGQVFAATGPVAIPSGSFLHGGGTIRLAGVLDLERGILEPGADVLIEDLVIDGNRVASGQTTQFSGIRINDVSGVRVRNNEIKGCSWAGVHIFKGEDLVVSGNRIHDIYRLQNDPIGNPDPPYFAEGVVITSAYESYATGAQRKPRAVRDNWIWDVQDTGVGIQQGTVNFEVSGNHIWDLVGDSDPNYKWSGSGLGINIGHSSANGVVSGNHLRRIGTVYGYNAIQMEANRNVVVSGNVAVNDLEKDLFGMAEITAGYGVVFSDNSLTVKNTGTYSTHGLHLAGCSNCTITGNTIQVHNRNLVEGIWVDGRGPYGESPDDIDTPIKTTYYGVWGTTLSNNTVWGFDKGIRVWGPNQGLQIDGNFLNVDQVGISVDGGYDGLISGNQIQSLNSDTTGNNAGAILLSNTADADSFLVQQDSGGTDLSLDASTRYASQSFVPNVPVLLTRVYVYLKRVGSPTGNFSFAIYSDNAGKPGSLLSGAGAANWSNRTFSSWAASNVPTSYAFYFVAELLPKAIILNAGTTYHFVVTQTGGSSGNYLAINTSNANPYSGGVVNVSADGTNWTTVSGSDFAFRIDKTVDPRRWLVTGNSVYTPGQCFGIYSGSSTSQVEDITIRSNSCTGTPGSSAVGIHDYFGSGGGSWRRAYLDNAWVNIATPLAESSGATNRRVGTSLHTPADTHASYLLYSDNTTGYTTGDLVCGKFSLTCIKAFLTNGTAIANCGTAASGEFYAACR